MVKSNKYGHFVPDQANLREKRIARNHHSDDAEAVQGERNHEADVRRAEVDGGGRDDLGHGSDNQTWLSPEPVCKEA